jgi:2-dehydropantoate 2-reductase
VKTGTRGAESRPAPAAAGALPVAVVGAGAVGCYYGARLAAAGVPVTMIGRPVHVAAMRKHGLRLTTADTELLVHVGADTEPAAAAGATLVLVCVKSNDTEAAGAALAPHLAPGAVVLSLQNGVDNARRLQAVLGAPVQPAVVYVASEMAGPGHVRHLGRGELVLSSVPPAGLAASPAEIVAAFATAGVPVELSDNVPGALWSKLVLNCAYNALSAATGLPYGPLVLQPGIQLVMRDAVLECIAVAAAMGIVLPGNVFEAVDRIAITMPDQFSSTAQDVRRGKPSEIDHLNGYIVREGERLGLPTPVNRTLHALVKAIDLRASGSATGSTLA